MIEAGHAFDLTPQELASVGKIIDIETWFTVEASGQIWTPARARERRFGQRRVAILAGPESPYPVSIALGAEDG